MLTLTKPLCGGRAGGVLEGGVQVGGEVRRQHQWATQAAGLVTGLEPLGDSSSRPSLLHRRFEA